MTLACSGRAVEMLSQHFDLKLHGRWVCGTVPDQAPAVTLRREALHRLLGPVESEDGSQELDDLCVEQCLTALGCTLTPTETGWTVVSPPSRRQDLQREVDLIEEVARLTGFDRFGAHLPDPLAPGMLTARQEAERRLRRLLCAAGLQEVWPCRWWERQPANPGCSGYPLLAETSHLRTNLGRSIFDRCPQSQSIPTGLLDFEIGHIYTARLSRSINAR